MFYFDLVLAAVAVVSSDIVAVQILEMMPVFDVGIVAMETSVVVVVVELVAV